MSQVIDYYDNCIFLVKKLQKLKKSKFAFTEYFFYNNKRKTKYDAKCISKNFWI